MVGLVYVAAFAPDEGEQLGDNVCRFKDIVLGTALEPQYQYPDGGATAIEVYDRGREVPRGVHRRPAAGAVRTSTARPSAPIAAGAFADRGARRPGRNCRPGPSSAPGDNAAGTDVAREKAQRAGSESLSSRAPTSS